jgi:hypothetical protein
MQFVARLGDVQSADLILVAGDFNLYSYPVGSALVDRSLSVWSRLAGYGGLRPVPSGRRTAAEAVPVSRPRPAGT